MNSNTMIAVCVVCVTAFLVAFIGANYNLRMATLDTNKSIAETKAEEGFKFKFGITKEKD